MAQNFIYDNSLINIDFIDILNSLPNAIGIKNSQSIFIGVNEATAKLTGFNNSEEMIGVDDANIKCPTAEFYETFIQQDQATLQGYNQKNLDLSRYADGNIHAFISTKNKFKDKNKNEFVLFSMAEIPIKKIAKLLTFLTNENKFTNEPLGSFQLNYMLNQQQHPCQLSQKQAECLFYLVRGKTVKEIARLLHKSARTIEDHVENLKNQFNCLSKSELIDKAFQMGIAQIIPPSLIADILQ